eukprot:TRINITY_DN15199_c0_g1_i1.p1 TRINITY_DN15199_c0_g1~~TRINITY_DN15199_c0_g1_i1.p1  ORF type:complete len:277 (+),score=40.51 TRINITY_DN15199_c0_g1_i1:64-831(+)
MTGLWLVSVAITNVSIVDTYWGPSFMVMVYAFDQYLESSPRSQLINAMIYLWALRLAAHIGSRAIGHGIFVEDIRYQNFRRYWGPKYWLISYLQTFVLQGVIGWIVALPLVAAKYFSSSHDQLTTLDYVGVVVFAVGFFFETVGDFQLRMFQRRKDRQPGEVLRTGLWRYTRHPNYFGDATLWWGIWLVSVSSDYIMGLVSSISPLIMTFLLIKVSGVAMLDKVMTRKTAEYVLYKETTSAFIPWFPKKQPKRAD